MRPRLSVAVGVGILALSVLMLPALAHHGWGGNSDEEFQISGTVETGVSLAGPHATMKIKAEPARQGRRILSNLLSASVIRSISASPCTQTTTILRRVR